VRRFAITHPPVSSLSKDLLRDVGCARAYKRPGTERRSVREDAGCATSSSVSVTVGPLKSVTMAFAVAEEPAHQGESTIYPDLPDPPFAHVAAIAKSIADVESGECGPGWKSW